MDAASWARSFSKEEGYRHIKSPSPRVLEILNEMMEEPIYVGPFARTDVPWHPTKLAAGRRRTDIPNRKFSMNAENFTECLDDLVPNRPESPPIVVAPRHVIPVDHIAKRQRSLGY